MSASEVTATMACQKRAVSIMPTSVQVSVWSSQRRISAVECSEISAGRTHLYGSHHYYRSLPKCRDCRPGWRTPNPKQRKEGRRRRSSWRRRGAAARWRGLTCHSLQPPPKSAVTTHNRTAFNNQNTILHSPAPPCRNHAVLEPP